MGGNALPDVPTRRLSAAEFHPLVAKLTAALRERFGARAEAIPAYRTKADFGDLDLLVEQEKVLVPGDGHALLKAFALETGFARAFNANGNVLSYDHRNSPQDVEGFQVDLLLTPALEFDAALNYFSYNDLGNLVGRTAHKMGFSYGHRGLLYPFRDGDHMFRTLIVTQDTDRALDFLGYIPARFHEGFEDLPAIFDYVTSSAYFNRDIFLLENRNHTSRMRDRKRKTYTDFLRHLENHPELPAFQYPESKAVWLPQAFGAFPAFEKDHRQTTQDLEESREIRKVFNGLNVGEWTGLSGKELGGFMSDVRGSFASSSELAQFIRREGEEGLRVRVVSLLPRPKQPAP